MLQVKRQAPTFGTVPSRMNAQTVLQVLEQPTLLSEYGMEELQALAREFPYATNLRLLVLLKAKQMEDPDFEQYLNRFSAATFDRAHLFHLLEAIEKREEEKGEVLELLELEELELAGFGAPFEELPSRLNELSLPETESSSEEKMPPAPRPVITALPPQEKTTAAVPQPAADWTKLADAFFDLIPSPSEGSVKVTAPAPESGETRPEDPTRFAALVASRRQRVPLEVRLRKLRRSARPSVAAAGDSTVDHGAAVSETLAALLVRQGQLQNAIKMYRRLILLYPDKKPIFAGLIKDLKEKI